jgi:hypothetical protein
MTEQERQDRMARLNQCIKLGEDAYGEFYEPRTYASPAGHFSDAKDFFGEAIHLARALGLEQQARQLSERLEEIKAVYRGQFSGFNFAPPPAAAFPEPPAPAVEPEPDAIAAEIQHIRDNAAFVVATFKKLVEFEFGCTDESVKWLDGYIERVRGNFASEADRAQLVSNLGSYLGEAILAAQGGAWARDRYGWHIRFDEEHRAYPFNKVEKQFVYGAEDSIYGFYRSIPALRNS